MAREPIDEYQRLANAYDPDKRVANCPDPDAVTMARVEIDFAIPVEMTQAQQRRLLEVIDDIVDSPWNAPAEGVHWMAGVGSKMHWSRVDAALLGITPGPDAPASGEPTYDESVYHVHSHARAFVNDHERSRKVERRGDRRPESPDRTAMDVAIVALEAVAEFWGKDPEAFGDDATVTSLAGRFSRVANKCRKALVLIREEQLKREYRTRTSPDGED